VFRPEAIPAMRRKRNTQGFCSENAAVRNYANDSMMLLPAELTCPQVAEKKQENWI
jgi:hypothetical protein